MDHYIYPNSILQPEAAPLATKFPAQETASEIQDRGYCFDSLGLNPLSLPQAKRPRERLNSDGPGALTDHDLLAILLNTGVQGKNVSVLAMELLELLDRDKGIPSIKELCRLTGMGVSKASAIAAMLEFGRRRWGASGTHIKHPTDIFNTVRHFADRRQERFVCLSLNGAHELLKVRTVTLGLVNKTIVHPREVFADPIQDRASAICVAHNHPSGQLKPSPEDGEITFQLFEAAKILGLRFLDHVIFTDTGYFSYRQAGLLGGD
ncbi:RadC family protein [Treponema primitia]|uniref:RadC family protein n=1 Tax=Treponema primitia TaxID=88058 RepID=UPI000255559D|nr:DNA repair protein RadC [Treponema primitia]